MRFMVIMIPAVYRGNKKLDPNFISPESMERMGTFNAELEKAGAVLALDGLHPLTQGARVTFSQGKVSVTDGPFVEAKEVFGGYWMLEAKSKEDVITWMKKCPAEDGDIIEIRQVFEMSDFPSEIQKGEQR